MNRDKKNMDVLKHFRESKNSRNSLVKAKSGGSWPKKKKCKKKFGKRGGGCGKVLKAIAGIGLGIGAAFAGKKILKNFKDNGGF
tara:strand:- start:236 stop:487 length:252 start_codon:yes stop_codon:yes gene_type:complete